MVYLALKKVAPKGFFPKLFWWLTKWRLLTQFPHAGVMIKNDYFPHGDIFHTTISRGVHPIIVEKFDNKNWLFVRVNVDFHEVMNRYYRVLGAPYDWFSLLAFALPFRFTKASWFYCYELAWFLLKGEIPTFRVTPEMLLKFALENNNKYDNKPIGDTK